MADAAVAAAVDRRWTSLFVYILVCWLVLSLLVTASIFGDVTTRMIGTPTFYVLHVLGHMSIIAVALCATRARQKILERKDVLIPVLLYGLLVIFSTASASYETAHAAATRMVQAFLVPATILSFGVCLPAIFSAGAYRKLFSLFTVILCISSLLSLSLMFARASHFGGRELTRWGDYRGGRFAATGLYVNPNAIGAVLESFPAIIVHLIRVGKRFRALYATAGALILLNLVLTFSRSSQGVAIASLSPLLLWLDPKRLAIGCAVAWLALVVVIGTSVVQLRWYVEHELTLTPRAIIWQDLLPKIAEKPLLGFGLFNVTHEGQTAHNVYLTQLLYYGWAGFLAFVVMLASFACRVWSTVAGDRNRPDVWVLTALLVGILGQGTVEYIITYPLFFTNSLFWLLLGMMAHKNL